MHVQECMREKCLKEREARKAKEEQIVKDRAKVVRQERKQELYKHYGFLEEDCNHLRNGTHAQIRGVQSTYYDDTYSSSESEDELAGKMVYGNTDNGFTNSANADFSENIGKVKLQKLENYLRMGRDLMLLIIQIDVVLRYYM